MNENLDLLNKQAEENLEDIAAEIDSQPTYQSIGNKLKEIREEKNITHGEVIAKIKIPLNFLTAIEEGDWSVIPNVIYTRAFVRDYAKLLAVDIETPLNTLFPSDHNFDNLLQSPISEVKTLLLNGNSHSIKTSSKSFLFYFIILILVLLLALAIIFSESFFAAIKSQFPIRDGEVAQNEKTIIPATPITSNTPSLEPTINAENVEPTINAEYVEQTINAENVEQTISTPSDANSNLAESEADDSIENTENMLSLATSKKSWIQVRSQNGAVLYEKYLSNDDKFNEIVKPPFMLVIGNAESVSVKFNGKEINLKPHLTPNGNARLTIE